MKAENSDTPDYEREKEILQSFFENYQDRYSDDTATPYIQQLMLVANRESQAIKVCVEHLQDYLANTDDSSLAKRVLGNTKRYQKLFYEVADRLMPPPTTELASTPQDTLLAQRLQVGSLESIPAELRRNYDLVLCHDPDAKKDYRKLREIGAQCVGALIDMRGVVTRVSDIKPHMAVATYICANCGHEDYKIIGGMTYLPLAECNSDKCRANNSRGSLHHETRASKFISFQEIRIQEPAEEVPMGQVPRTMKVYAYGHVTNQCTPGQLISITGVFLTMPYAGMQAVYAGLLHDTYIEAFEITPLKKSYRETQMSQTSLQQMTGNMYERLAYSIAPEIFGLEDVKKALLLLLVGGVTKEMADGMKIRGDLNILLMGDPGVAKSQLLKQISLLTPRGIYTTGKGSSGVGLTAAVLKDTITGEMVLEGGALVLADQGICCIDEFDKMDERDRTAIHEVMEQQTVSIAKAGITTTLNARTSVLAAANPLYGRYNKQKTPRENINLPAALLSRFDLVFLLLDTADEASDLALAEAVTFVHQHLHAKDQMDQMLTSEFMREYISEAKRMEPVIREDLHAEIIQKYLEKRQEQKDIQKDGYVYVTPRTLLGIIRLAQALAKLRFAEEVVSADIAEALRLMEASRASVNLDNTERRRADPISAIFQMIKLECQKTSDYSSEYAKLERRAVALGFSKEQLDTCLKTYEDLSVLVATEGGRKVMLVS